MTKILSRSGDSLADVYDVEGSIAGIDELQSKDVNLVHEMGGVLFSERLSGRVVTLTTGNILASANFSINFSVSNTSRLLAATVIVDDIVRIARWSLAVTSGPGQDNTEVPIGFWKTSDLDRSVNVLIGGSVSLLFALIPIVPMMLPQLMIGQDSPRPISTVTFRGDAAAFGGGNVEVQALLYFAFPETAGLSSRGLPVPGW